MYLDRLKLDLNGDHIGAFVRPCTGETRSGDAVVAVERAGTKLFAIIDALGHGKGAAAIALRVAGFLDTFPSDDLTVLAKGVDDLLRGGGSASGAAFGVALVHPSGQLRYLGVGNTTARIVSAKRGQLHLVSKDGVAGQSMPSSVEQNARLERDELLVLTTDGIQSRLGHDDQTKAHVFMGPAYQIAVRVVRLFGKDYDDAACLVYRHT